MNDNILEVTGVTVSFDGFKVLDDLDFSIRRGELRFLIGPNGAGKSTLLDIITAKTRASKGKVMFDGHINVGRLKEHQIVRQGIARKFQTPSVFGSLTVYENLEVAIGFKSPLSQLAGQLSAAQREAVETTLETINLTGQRNASAGILAHGQKQWLEIGMLLVQQPKLLLLDEPIAGMTRRERDYTGELLHRIAADRSILVVEHDMQFVREFATTVTVLHQGRLLREGPVEQIQADPEVIEVYLGRSHARPAA